MDAPVAALNAFSQARRKPEEKPAMQQQRQPNSFEAAQLLSGPEIPLPSHFAEEIKKQQHRWRLPGRAAARQSNQATHECLHGVEPQSAPPSCQSESAAAHSEISKQLGLQWRRMTDSDKRPLLMRPGGCGRIICGAHPGYKYRPRRRARCSTANSAAAAAAAAAAAVAAAEMDRRTCFGGMTGVPAHSRCSSSLSTGSPAFFANHSQQESSIRVDVVVEKLLQVDCGVLVQVRRFSICGASPGRLRGLQQAAQGAKRRFEQGVQDGHHGDEQQHEPEEDEDLRFTAMPTSVLIWTPAGANVFGAGVDWREGQLPDHRRQVEHECLDSQHERHPLVVLELLALPDRLVAGNAAVRRHKELILSTASSSDTRCLRLVNLKPLTALKKPVSIDSASQPRPPAAGNRRPAGGPAERGQSMAATTALASCCCTLFEGAVGVDGEPGRAGAARLVLQPHQSGVGLADPSL
uniref:HMG box domain-containing protein n=1 Tax=Macrostomum lignano TaxID=282301 RepID=A0A1I8FU57_9PLAT